MNLGEISSVYSLAAYGVAKYPDITHTLEMFSRENKAKTKKKQNKNTHTHTQRLNTYVERNIKITLGYCFIIRILNYA